jgi:hypothetical protein
MPSNNDGTDKKEGVGSAIYSGVAMYGRFRAVIGAIMGTIIALVLIIIGVVRLKDRRTATATMTVVSASCAKRVQSDKRGDTYTDYVCIATVSYRASNGGQYVVSNVNIAAPSPLVPDALITLRYDPANPADVIQDSTPRALGWGLIAGGILVGAISVGVAVMTFKSKEFAAVSGAVGIADTLVHGR